MPSQRRHLRGIRRQYQSRWIRLHRCRYLSHQHLQSRQGINCDECGAKLDDSAEFCDECIRKQKEITVTYYKMDRSLVEHRTTFVMNREYQFDEGELGKGVGAAGICRGCAKGN